MRPSNERSEHNWKLDPVIQEIKEFIKIFTYFESIHVEQNANKVADRLVNMGANAHIRAQVVNGMWPHASQVKANLLKLINHGKESLTKDNVVNNQASGTP